MQRIQENIKTISSLGIATKKKSTVRKKANELDGKTWLHYSISVWDDIKKSPEELKLKHPAMFPSQLPKRLMEMFLTNDQKIVLDPFVGIGSTLIAAQELDKEGYGFEISKEYVEIARKRLSEQIEMFVQDRGKQTIYNEDARNIKKHLDRESVDICITSPPYWDILSQKRTADYKATKDYGEQKDNLGNIHNYRTFLVELREIFESVYFVLKKGSYCIIDVMDLRKKSKFYPYHIDVINFMLETGFLLDDIIIWDRRREYNNLRPLGYPSVFRINKIHEYILIFKKPDREVV